MAKKKFSPSFLSGTQFHIDDKFVKFDTVIGGMKFGTIPKSSIKAVIVEPGRKGANLKFVGEGTDLASIEDMPIHWAEKSQAWLMDQLDL